MGRMLIDCAKEDSGLAVSAALDQGDDLIAGITSSDVVIDFSHADATAQIALWCADAGKALVIGTTGQTDESRSTVRQCAEKIPIVFAANYSIGVNTLFWLTRRATEILGEGFDLEVVEMHHRLKKDAPSGTARRLAEILAEVRELRYATAARHGREGMVGERTASEIGVHSLRGGDVVGDHTVVFASVGERVELTHKASSRETFAKGALRAAKWASGREAGLFDMEDVLDLRHL